MKGLGKISQAPLKGGDVAAIEAGSRTVFLIPHTSL